MNWRKVFLALVIATVHCATYGQQFDKSISCIVDSFDNPGTIFTRIETSPGFNGNMQRFLTNNIGLDLFLNYMRTQDTLFADSARIKFVVDRWGHISNVSISRVKSPLFQAEIMRLFRLSSCNWQPGEQSGRKVNGWAQFDVYFRLARRNGEVKMNVDYRQHEPPEMPME